MKTVFNSLVLLVQWFFLGTLFFGMVVFMIFIWLFGAKITVSQNKIPIGYIRWFKFYSL